MTIAQVFYFVLMSTNYVITPALFFVGVALVVLGIVRFLLKKPAKKFLLWGVVSLVSMIVLWGLLNLAATGYDGDQRDIIPPSVPMSDV